MCIMFKEQYEEIGYEIFRIVSQYDYMFEGDIEKLTEHVKDELADSKERGEIGVCGCDGFFEVKVLEGRIYIVNMEILGSIWQFENHVIGDNTHWSMESKTMVEIIDGYDDIVYNEYTDE